MGIDSFQILRGLGEGAFASVHKVTRKSDGKTYALKKVDVSSLDDKELVSALNEVGPGAWAYTHTHTCKARGCV